MSQYSETTLTFRSLYSSPIVSVSDYVCGAYRGGPRAEEHSVTNGIALMRHGAFCKHFGRRSVTADVNQAVFFSKESTYRAVIRPTAAIAVLYLSWRRTCLTTSYESLIPQSTIIPNVRFPS